MIVHGWDFSPDQLMRPGQVADLFRVDPKTVRLWGDAGKLTCVRTPSGQRRFSRQQVERLVRERFGQTQTDPDRDGDA